MENNNNKTPEEKRMELLSRLGVDHILEQTAIFKETLHEDVKLDPETVAEIKRRFKIWHKTWIEKQMIELFDYIEKCEKEK